VTSDKPCAGSETRLNWGWFLLLFRGILHAGRVMCGLVLKHKHNNI
jgi:hypothetical protein